MHPIKGDAKQQILTYLYFFILALGIAYVWLLAVETPFDLAWPLKAVLFWNLETFFIPVLVLPLMLTLVIHRAIHRSFWYGVVIALIGGLIALTLADIQETGWLIFGIVGLAVQIIIVAAISLLGLPARHFFKIRSQPARIGLLIVPIIILFLMGNAFYVSPTREYCDSSLIKEAGKHNQCFRVLAIKMLDLRICANIISDMAHTEVGWCMKDVLIRQQKQGTLSPSACDVITMDSRNVNACISALTEIRSS